MAAAACLVLAVVALNVYLLLGAGLSTPVVFALGAAFGGLLVAGIFLWLRRFVGPDDRRQRGEVQARLPHPYERARWS